MMTREINLSVISSSNEQRARVVTVEKAVMARNDVIAAQNRERFHRLGILALNVMSSPGSGKTAFLVRTLEHFVDRANAGVIVGDLATDRDANRLASTGVDTVQIQTGNVCHLEADMVARSSQALGLAGRDLLVIENVPLVSCPHCGESYMTAATLHEIERIKRQRARSASKRPVTVAVFA